MTELTADRAERRKRLQEELGIDNPQAVPTVEKVVVNVGIGDAPQDVSKLESVQQQLARITGQQPVVTRAKKSVASFGIRKGDPAGVKVTLRERRMEDFLARLIHLALPRTRDFSGLNPNSFDGGANYSLGVDEQFVFPEISYDEEVPSFGMDVTIVTSTTSRDEAFALLEEYGMPFASASS